ncbi:hypothetical protein E2C01_082885 [Portunus trituberculatus]|uniref:Uncharacterized protein n=1 Tax=Portunus trituberculatus TaxID=210409 RepID=A0A5B7J206_PORTR|nr:hypothetical protein [Portunus trituberculatus]
MERSCHYQGRTKPAYPNNPQPAAANWFFLHWKTLTVLLHLPRRNWILPRIICADNVLPSREGGHNCASLHLPRRNWILPRPRTSSSVTTRDAIQGSDDTATLYLPRRK